MAKKTDKVTATLLKFDCILDGHKHIKAKFMFDLTQTSVAQLYKMRQFYVVLEEPDRGVERKPLGEFSGRILDIAVPKAPKKEGKLTMVFPDADLVVAALRQISECEPATVHLIQSEMELELDEPDAEYEADHHPDQAELPAA